jgi:hypothetical protein
MLMTPPKANKSAKRIATQSDATHDDNQSSPKFVTPEKNKRKRLHPLPEVSYSSCCFFVAMYVFFLIFLLF